MEKYLKNKKKWYGSVLTADSSMKEKKHLRHVLYVHILKATSNY